MSSARHRIIRVDALVRPLSIEEVRHKLGDTRYGGYERSPNQDDLMDVSLVNLRISKNLLDGLKSAAKRSRDSSFETGTGKGDIEVDVSQRESRFDGSLSWRGKDTLNTLAGGADTTDGTRVRGEI